MNHRMAPDSQSLRKKGNRLEFGNKTAAEIIFLFQGLVGCLKIIKISLSSSTAPKAFWCVCAILFIRNKNKLWRWLKILNEIRERKNKLNRGKNYQQNHNKLVWCQKSNFETVTDACHSFKIKNLLDKR